MAYPAESEGIPWPIPLSEEKRNFRSLAIMDREQASVLLHWLADPKSRSAQKEQVAQCCDAFYQFKRRFLLGGQKVTPKRLERLARVRIKAIQGGKLSAAEKRRRVCFLKGFIA
jgi:hypothetical protein